MTTNPEDAPSSPSQRLPVVERGILAAAVEQAADSIMVTDVQGTIQYVNPSFTATTGYASEEAVGQNPRLLKSGCHSAEFYEDMWSTILSGRVWRGELSNRRKDGTIYQEESRISSVQDANGRVLGYIAIKRDVTERMQAVEALRESEVRFRSMADSCPSMLWVTDASGRVDFINRMYREFAGITCEEARVGEWRLLLHPDDADQYIAAFESAMRNHTSFDAEARVRRADNEWRLMGTRAEPRFSASGEYLGHIGLRADITERRKAEDQRQFQHSLIRAIYEGSPDGILVVNAQHEIASHNQRFFQVWGIPATDVVGTVQAPRPGFPRRQLILSALERVKHPEEFEMRLQKLYADPDADDNCEIELKDGRTLERYSTSLRSEKGSYLARVLFYRDITARKRAEHALHESEERFRIMADGCPMPLWITNPEGEIQLINHAFQQFCGDTSDRVKGHKWQMLLHPDDAPAFLEGIFCSLREHRSHTAETRLLRGDGEWRWLAAYVAPRFSPSGEFLGHVGLGTDVTDRKEAEHALQVSEKKFRQLAENIPQVFWLAAPGKKGFLYVSPAYAQVWGRSCESVYRDPDSQLEAIHPDDRARLLPVFERQMQGEELETEYRIHTPAGEQKWIRVRTFPIRDGNGQLIRVAGIMEEVTEQRRHEEELTRAREEAEAANLQLSAEHAILDRERKILRAFIDNVPELMYVKDVESRFVIANAEATWRMGAKSPEELIGKTTFDFLPHDIAIGFYEDDQTVIRTGNPVIDREVKVRSRTPGEISYLLTTKVPLFDSKGRLSGIAGIARDITARKRDENALRERNRQLREANDRANQLAMEAEAANHAKSEFLANMSHEIRTPMNGVLGMISLLLDTDLGVGQRHYAELAEDSAKSLLTVIDDILDFSKVEAGKLEIDNVDFNLHVLMGGFADAMAERVREKPVEFVCAVAPNVCGFLRGDPGRLRQVLMNLVGNAMKFTHQGEVVVHADMDSETDTTASLRFSVRDTGIGIPREKQQLLFTSFTQVDASTTRQYGGTGLGLAISKKLVELMGGEIRMESKEGEGSEFWFTLPFGKQPACGQHPELSHASMNDKRILVVDDNATNREVLTAQMQSWGVDVIAVENGAAALASLRQAVASGSPFQMAVVDMMMPGMDGATLGGAILADDALKSTPLVMMTSFGGRGDALRFKQIGFAAYLVKPVRQSDLFDCLVAVLAGEPEAEQRSLITRHSLETARRSNARILLVEDNLTNQEVASGMLLRMGWRADIRANGKQAIEALETHPYDLVLMDVQMPEMDGYQAARVIRDPQSCVLNHNIPIVATTAHAMTGDAEKCLAAGMNDYIAKPIDPKTLSKVVEKWLTRKVHSVAAENAVESSPGCKGLSPKPRSATLIFNREAFLERMMGDKEFAQEVVDAFVTDLPALLIELKEKVALGAIESVWKQAHKIKGSAANVGGEALRDVASEMENAGKAGDLPGVVRWIPALDMQAERLSEALQQWSS